MFKTRNLSNIASYEIEIYIRVHFSIIKSSLGSQVGLRRKTVILQEILRSGVRLAPWRYFYFFFVTQLLRADSHSFGLNTFFVLFFYTVTLHFTFRLFSKFNVLCHIRTIYSIEKKYLLFN